MNRRVAKSPLTILACVAGAWKVVGERENGRARGRHAFFFCAHYFQAPATQAILPIKMKKGWPTDGKCKICSQGC